MLLDFNDGILYFGAVPVTAPLSQIEPDDDAQELFSQIILVDKDLKSALETARASSDGFYIGKIASITQDVLEKHNLSILDDALLINYSGSHALSLMMSPELKDLNFYIAVAALEMYETCNDYLLFHRQAYEKDPSAYDAFNAEKAVFLSWLNAVKKLEAHYNKPMPGFEFSVIP